MINKLKQTPVVYTAHSRKVFFAREMISAFVLNKGAVPINPFLNFGYFLGDRTDRNLLRDANNTVITRCDEVWQFGDISNGCLSEIQLAEKLGKKVVFFSVGKSIDDIYEISAKEVSFEKPELETIATNELPQYFSHLNLNEAS